MLCAAPGEDGAACGRCAHCRKALAGNHPNIVTVSRRADEKGKQRREIVVEQIREGAASAAVLPNEAERKVYLILEADAMNPAAQNAFLKLLEDPPPFDAFILAAENTDALLETVRSRCRTVRLEGTEAEVSAEARELAERYLDLAAARARVSLLSFSAQHEDMKGEELADFLAAVRQLSADMLCGRLPDRGMPRRALMALAALADRGAEYLRFNVSTKHILGMLAVTPAMPFDPDRDGGQEFG